MGCLEVGLDIDHRIPDRVIHFTAFRAVLVIPLSPPRYFSLPSPQ
jgi:hypothetical protein